MSNPRWLDIVRHTVKGFRAPYALVIQHHEIPSARVLVAPVTLPVRGDVDALAPPLIIDGVLHRTRLLDIGAIPRPQIRDIVMSAADDADAIMNALDIILHGYPVGRP